MVYMGSKARHAKDLLPIILRNRKPGQWYVEPFVGGFNMIDKVLGKRMACDSNKYLIALFHELQKGWIPPEEISEELYNDVRVNKEKYSDTFIGLVGFTCTYSGKWFGGYARGDDRNYYRERRANILSQVEKIKGVAVLRCNYDELEIPENSIIYCDPPYAGTTKYKDSFNHDKFWQWCRDKAKKGHEVFVSEYNAPDDFRCVWCKEVKCSLTSSGKYTNRNEKLFTI